MVGTILGERPSELMNLILAMMFRYERRYLDSYTHVVQFCSGSVNCVDTMLNAPFYGTTLWIQVDRFPLLCGPRRVARRNLSPESRADMLRHVKHAVDGTFFDRWLAYVRTAHQGTTLPHAVSRPCDAPHNTRQATCPDILCPYYSLVYVASGFRGGRCPDCRRDPATSVQREHSGWVCAALRAV